MGTLSNTSTSKADIRASVDSDRYIGKVEASRYLSLSARNIEQRLDEIPHYRVGRKLLFKKSELEQWMAQYKEPTDSSDLRALADEAVAALENEEK